MGTNGVRNKGGGCGVARYGPQHIVIVGGLRYIIRWCLLNVDVGAFASLAIRWRRVTS